MPEFSIGRFRGGYCVTWPDASIRAGRRRYTLEATTREAALAEGRARYLEATRPAGDVTVAVIWEAYRKTLGDRATGETMLYTGKAILPHFGALKPEAIGAAECEDYIDARRAKGKHDGSIVTELGHLRSALVWAAKPGRDRMIPEAPTITRPKKPDPKDRWLTRAEVDKLLAAALAPHVRLAIVLMLSTAGRVGAILELTWARVNFEAGTIDLRKEADGPRKGRTLAPMNRTARAALLAAREAALSDHVIEWGGEPVSCVLRGVKAAAARAGLTGVSPHALRRTAAVWMAEAGVPMEKISTYLGHTNAAFTAKVYAQYSPGHLRDAADVLDLGAHKLQVIK